MVLKLDTFSGGEKCARIDNKGYKYNISINDIRLLSDIYVSNNVFVENDNLIVRSTVNKFEFLVQTNEKLNFKFYVDTFNYDNCIELTEQEEMNFIKFTALFNIIEKCIKQVINRKMNKFKTTDIWEIVGCELDLYFSIVENRK